MDKTLIIRLRQIYKMLFISVVIKNENKIPTDIIIHYTKIGRRRNNIKSAV